MIIVDLIWRCLWQQLFYPRLVHWEHQWDEGLSFKILKSLDPYRGVYTCSHLSICGIQVFVIRAAVRRAQAGMQETETFRMAAWPRPPPQKKEKNKSSAAAHDKWSRVPPVRTMERENETRVSARNEFSLWNATRKKRKSITATNTLVNIKRIMLHCTGRWLWIKRGATLEMRYLPSVDAIASII